MTLEIDFKIRKKIIKLKFKPKKYILIYNYFGKYITLIEFVDKYRKIKGRISLYNTKMETRNSETDFFLRKTETKM